jgi:carboxypeptidase C (cathepsin A)
MLNKPVLGVDIGNVIINNRLNHLQSLHEKGYAILPVVEGALEGLQTLNESFKGNVHLISKCTEWAQEQILRWLKAHNFYNLTGINSDHIHFVRERHEKDLICQKLGVTNFIDDRLEVLSHMIKSTPHLLLFQPDSTEIKAFEKFLRNVTVVNSWKEVLNLIQL